MKEYLNIKELSEYLGIKTSTLYAKVSAGQIPHYKINRLVRFGKDDIDEWLESQKRDAEDVESRVGGIIAQMQRKVFER